MCIMYYTEMYYTYLAILLLLLALETPEDDASDMISGKSFSTSNSSNRPRLVPEPRRSCRSDLATV